METKANYIAVGLFTLLAVVAAFAFVYWTAGIDRGDLVTLRVRIPGSASGLARGSAVLFNGVRVGDVRRVSIDIRDPAIAIAETRVDRLTPITRSTKADIGIAGLTGQANIELRGVRTDEPNLLQQAAETGEVAEIVADPSAVTNLLQTAQTILTRADNALYSAKRSGRNRALAWRGATTATTARPVKRRRVLKAGRLVFNDRNSVIDCTVRALWAQGAEVQIATASDLPEHLTLELISSGNIWPARIVQRRPSSLELAFV